MIFVERLNLNHNIFNLSFLKSKFKLKFLLFSFLLTYIFCGFSVFGQNSDRITIKGKVIDPNYKSQGMSLLILNKTNSVGTFGNIDGTFHITANKNDVIIFSVHGYAQSKLCFKDSVYRDVYTVQVELKKLEINLSQVEIFPVRNVDEIKKDIEKLEFVFPYQTSGAAAFNSPITALYERFSKFEKSKRAVAYMINEEKKRDLLKELFHIYIKADIINLKSEEFDAFLNFCNLPQSFIQSANEYELTMAVKACYEEYDNDYVRKDRPKRFFNPSDKNTRRNEKYLEEYERFK